MDKGAYIQLKQELNEENAADLAEYFEELSAEKQLFIFRLLTKDMAAEVFSYMDSDTQEHIVHSITDKEVRNIVDEMFLDDTVDFLEEAPANLVKNCLLYTSHQCPESCRKPRKTVRWLLYFFLAPIKGRFSQRSPLPPYPLRQRES